MYFLSRSLSSLILMSVIFAFLFSDSAWAQDTDPFRAPEFRKVTTAERADFESRFDDINWTGAGFRDDTIMDQIPTSEVRARLQAVFGDPTVKVENLIGRSDFRPGMYIQFEYWFVINETIPLMILDVDGPFRRGLVYGGASRYIDLMPEIKRELSRKIMGVTELGEFQDYFYEIDSDTWYRVEYKNGRFRHEKINNPF